MKTSECIPQTRIFGLLLFFKFLEIIAMPDIFIMWTYFSLYHEWSVFGRDRIFSSSSHAKLFIPRVVSIITKNLLYIILLIYRIFNEAVTIGWISEDLTYHTETTVQLSKFVHRLSQTKYIQLSYNTIN